MIQFPSVLSPDARLLALLRRSQEPWPVGDLAVMLSLSPAELAERLRALEAAGFEFERHPTRGLRLAGSPDRLIADDLWARLTAAQMLGSPAISFWRELIVLAETGSTNDVAAGLGREGASGPAAVFAERQTAGRGRFGRRWESLSGGGLWMSFLLRPNLAGAEWPRLSTWAAVTLASAVDRLTNVRTQIKWPNDLLLEGRKVAGILIEQGTDTQQQPFAVLGIGLNVNQGAEDFSLELRETAGSLASITGTRWDRSRLATVVLEEFAMGWPALKDNFPHVLEEARRRSSLLGRWVQAHTGAEAIEGVAEALDESGHLQVREPNGQVRTLLAGEVTLHREA